MTRIRSISSKRAAQHPELLTQGSTIARSNSKPNARKPVKKRNPARQKKESARAYGTKAYRDWLHRQECAIKTNCSFKVSCDGEIEQAHAKTGGTGRKADATLTFPACRVHHGYLHSDGIKTFERIYQLSVVALAEQTQAKWQATLAGATVSDSVRSEDR